MADRATELGKELGRSLQSQNRIQQNMSADESDAQLNIYNTEDFVIEGTLTVSSLSIATDSFVLDHPVYGELDSPTLQLDGGYSGSPTVLYTVDF